MSDSNGALATYSLATSSIDPDSKIVLVSSSMNKGTPSVLVDDLVFNLLGQFFAAGFLTDDGEALLRVPVARGAAPSHDFRQAIGG